MKSRYRYFIDTVISKAYWQYILFSKAGVKNVISVFGFIYLIVEIMDFFNMYTRDRYATFSVFLFFALSIIISALLRRPIKSVKIRIPQSDIQIEVRIVDIFELDTAVVISSNTKFEADVSGGKIDPNSLQGQFTAKYFTGNQHELIGKLNDRLKENISKCNSTHYSFGTTIPICTHGKTFYFVAMAELNDQGNAYTTESSLDKALNGLWSHISESENLQELAIPIIGTGRGRVKSSRKAIIGLIAESFVKASVKKKISDNLIITVHPNDACKFCINLYEIKDYLSQRLIT